MLILMHIYWLLDGVSAYAFPTKFVVMLLQLLLLLLLLSLHLLLRSLLFSR